jgi:hypothetical protein
MISNNNSKGESNANIDDVAQQLTYGVDTTINSKEELTLALSLKASSPSRERIQATSTLTGSNQMHTAHLASPAPMERRTLMHRRRVTAV